MIAMADRVGTNSRGRIAKASGEAIGVDHTQRPTLPGVHDDGAEGMAMRTFKRICIEDSVLEVENGDRMEIKRGEEYITSPVKADGTVIVFGARWAPFPVTLFAGERVFTES